MKIILIKDNDPRAFGESYREVILLPDSTEKMLHIVDNDSDTWVLKDMIKIGVELTDPRDILNFLLDSAEKAGIPTSVKSKIFPN